jgi:serine/threonine-protein kinase
MTRLIASEQQAVYAPSGGDGSGHVLFVRDGLLMAQPFDERRLELSGTAVPILADRIETNFVFASVAASSTGTLVYRKGTGAGSGRLTSVDRSGKTTLLLPGVSLEDASNPRLSPDGRRLALAVGDDLWLYDLEGRPPIKLTFSDGSELSPLWTRDGRRIVYEQGGEQPALFAIGADGSGSTPEAVAPDGHFHAHGWSADGREIIAVRVADNRGDLVQFEAKPGAVVREIVAAPGSEGYAASVSGDGRWVAYTSESTGRNEIWVRPLSDSGAAVRVSPGGGDLPVWAKDGRELYYFQDRKLMAVPVDAGSTFNFKPPVELFETSIVKSPQPPSYDVTPDGRFIMFTEADAPAHPISVVLSWAELLNRRTVTH